MAQKKNTLPPYTVHWGGHRAEEVRGGCRQGRTPPLPDMPGDSLPSMHRPGKIIWQNETQVRLQRGTIWCQPRDKTTHWLNWKGRKETETGAGRGATEWKVGYVAKCFVHREWTKYIPTSKNNPKKRKSAHKLGGA